ncbi:outer envelope pore protein 16-4, chloroplastic isoform X2 [Vigna angularis]|uniref:outer envelope pore protein 16-4, chloroplastic isoform X2 n=1 Tax=Phaseolus angularis TaxID=3914 RepID=UPI0022B58130|nr:outer envelope pore protein 16-4, chloroplastic isoform X2 [Vigna angularis]
MEENLDGVAPCSSLAVEAIIRVGAAGAIWGLCSGPYDARQQGLTGIAKASFVANSVRSFGIRCGFVAGVFSITRCGVQKYRGRNDWVSHFIFCCSCKALFCYGFHIAYIWSHILWSHIAFVNILLSIVQV